VKFNIARVFRREFFYDYEVHGGINGKRKKD
jgi:hypothetical protein